MLREGYVKLNLQSVEKYNKKLEKRHIENMKKVNELKEAYIFRANQIKEDCEKEILEKDKEIVGLKNQVEYLRKQKELIRVDLRQIPREIIEKYNAK